MKSTILNNLILSTFVSSYLCNDRINKKTNTNKITVAAMSTKLTTKKKQHRQQRLNG